MSNSEEDYTELRSIGADCQELRKTYDACFQNWFSNKFLKGDLKSDPCTELFKSYQECVKKAIVEQKIELWEIERDVLGTTNERQPLKK